MIPLGIINTSVEHGNDELWVDKVNHNDPEHDANVGRNEDEMDAQMHFSHLLPLTAPAAVMDGLEKFEYFVERDTSMR